jgi:hypothetical protein
MFNADGGIGWDKRKSYKKPYIRVNYTSSSMGLINQIHEIFSRMEILHSTHTKLNPINKAKMIQINGESNVRKFIKNIGFSNPRHLNKIRHLID